ncbi:bifunctional demethylmenaquinone methyltransferase/2-methoxy-6-polyprenyl-1,4-benzoquinol methylase UbiE [Proteiniphilum sp. X52]|uniref:bifunctional demethylmenaquinone methyltransferase/2-methoxy-6-polyprenyl-1,4-benzoquinol methylase UbiE n=1 Tax=Proteiniphilum sp. X52 TaxID=2382159 RepID=UPI000F09EC77|nr:bifunctional demethylmenaquinone methyltransferase/2-methoxy-6-polyprenyl-1,4-benzoquinol methylase UbiE [Proteiniphilum sp. X52]RNC64321.1 bifunctional demethylmenaquinone methyltransferase/2-methoxy-6-polyprenyl-1,4-benzoquinol methylase UbiE [Proteiniphilum sp. X52]
MTYKVEKVNPYDPDQPKKEQVKRMFDSIAPKYDTLNGTLSLGIDNYWRSDALKELRKYPHKQLLDIATGTGDFAILAQKILQPEKITAVDISEGMMNVGKEKVKAKGLEDIITFEVQDCANLTFADNSFDAVTIAFGVRNFEEIDKSFQEILRVLKAGGLFLFIELTTPRETPMKQLYATYTQYVMPLLSGIFSTEQRAYRYLPESIAAFPQGREMMWILKKNGFTNIRLRRYTLGIVTLYMAEKPID